jgi:CBS domain containing-hemolysin-like protein
MLSADMGREEVLGTVRESGHSRFPFTPTGQADDISGVVLAKELLLAIQEQEEPVAWSDIVRDTLFVPESMPLNQLLQSFRDARKHIAIVVDEYGGTQGIVALEDVLEELVGEIHDESDRLPSAISPLPDGSLRVPAETELRKLAARLGARWELDEDVVTLNGLLFAVLDRVPEKGDVAEWQGFRFEVESALDTRADSVVVRPLRAGRDAG